MSVSSAAEAPLAASSRHAGRADRFRAVLRLELAHTWKRPLLWMLVLLLALFVWGLASGDVSISSGDASVGGKKAWLTSEFSVAFQMVMLVSILYSFFLSIAAGMAILEDDERRIGEVLHATPL
ncbi:MAG TPA: hypothetical protein VOA87_21435, partial [Thermoanaerobaculia bacterium]|nr:hypothetical protein [Thermoanaerobaculia bacterium]